MRVMDREVVDRVKVEDRLRRYIKSSEEGKNPYITLRVLSQCMTNVLSKTEMYYTDFQSKLGFLLEREGQRKGLTKEDKLDVLFVLMSEYREHLHSR